MKPGWRVWAHVKISKLLPLLWGIVSEWSTACCSSIDWKYCPWFYYIQPAALEMHRPSKSSIGILNSISRLAFSYSAEPIIINHSWGTASLGPLCKILEILSSSSKWILEWWLANSNSTYLLQIWHLTWLRKNIHGCWCKEKGCQISSFGWAVAAPPHSSRAWGSGRAYWFLRLWLVCSVSTASEIKSWGIYFRRSTCYPPFEIYQ